MKAQFFENLAKELDALRQNGLYKNERVITSPQGAVIQTQKEKSLINLCANNYLGLSNDPDLIKAAHEALDHYGYGMSSVRFICGTQNIHKTLEKSLSQFLSKEDCILYSSCFDANAGLFETLLGEEDAIISDALNHASIIDGIRLCKANRYRYNNNDMKDLERNLQIASKHQFRLIATDGVFSMDGTFANLPKICELAAKYDSLVMVDDSHAIGFIGEGGRGTPNHFGVESEVDIVTGTLGKALGGASGGYTASRQEIVEWLRQRSRPYLFSNTLAPVIAATSIKVLEIIQTKPRLQKKLQENTHFFRESLSDLHFKLIPGEHPIIPIMIGDAKYALQFADKLFELGVYVTSFSYPVVPKGEARIRTQMSAALTRQELETAVLAFERAGKALGII